MSTRCIWQNRMSTAIHQLNFWIARFKLSKFVKLTPQWSNMGIWIHMNQRYEYLLRTTKNHEKTNHWMVSALHSSTPWCQSPQKKHTQTEAGPNSPRTPAHWSHPPIALAIHWPSRPHFAQIKVQWKQWRAHRDPPQAPAEIHQFYPFLMGFWWIWGPSAGKSLVSMGTYRD